MAKKIQPGLAPADFVARFPNFRVAVFGDLMLDRYIWGSASRISQEAPVPVVRVDSETEVPGGAANVVRNILGLGAKTVVFGAVGADAAGAKLRALLGASGADTSGVIEVGDRPTTTKTRLIAGNQQVARIDNEKTDDIRASALKPLLKKLLAALRGGQIQALILEDYAKGLLSGPMLQEIVDAAKAAGVLTAMDPHPSHPFKVKGLDLFTPNRREAFGLAGQYYQSGRLPIAEDTPLLAVGEALRRDWAVANCLITLGAQGMALFRKQCAPVHIPTRARAVFDVSGAGDTVIASFTLAMLAGAPPATAAEISNHAAGIVVAKVGTVPVTAAELLASLQE